MTLMKSILLASAAGIVSVAAAQAADLPTRKAAPAEYVKICNVGGMAALVRDGLNGFKFPKEPNIGEYCDYIIAMMQDRASYRRLAWSAFQEHQTRLNWTVAARATRDILADVVDNIQHAP